MMPCSPFPSGILLLANLLFMCHQSIAVAQDSATGSLWQGIDNATNNRTIIPVADAFQYLMLDTGGSGGMFGKGDVRSNLQSVDTLGTDIVWSVGDGGVFRSEDKGVSWQRVAAPDPVRGARWVRAALRDPDDVWILRSFHGLPKGELFRNRDDEGGWHQVLEGKLQGATDIQVSGRDIWVLCGDYPAYHSADGGKTWEVEAFGGLLHGKVAISVPGDISWDGGYTVYVLGHHQRKLRLIKSDDSGGTWSVVPLPHPLPPRYWLDRLFFASSLVGAIGLDDGRVLVTRDGGVSWISRNVSPGSRLTAMWMDQFGYGFAATENSNLDNPGTALYNTSSFEDEWRPIYSGRVQLNDITKVGPGHLMAVGNVVGIIPNDAVLHIRAPSTNPRHSE